MSGSSSRIRTFAWIVLVAALGAACERGDVLAPKDATITLTASPSEVAFDPNNLQQIKVSIAAVVLASGGYPNQGVSVTFTTSVSPAFGFLASNGKPVVTDSDNTARDRLWLNPGAPASVTVTATSGGLTKDVTITTSLGACTNEAPVADAGADQTDLDNALNTEFTVSLNGASSTGGSSTYTNDFYSWDCGNGTSGAEDSSHQNDARYAVCTYEATKSPQSWTVTLTVKSDPICDVSNHCVCQKVDTDTMTVTNTVPTRTP
jgi:hypothetical protein